MRKKKLTFLADLAVLVLCVCAIAIGVYSAKNASLNVGGTVGFIAHDCEVEVYGTITGAVDANDGAITGNTTTATTIFREGDSGTTGKLIKGNEAWNFGKIYFDDLNTTGDETAKPIVFTFVVTNKSAYDVLFEVTKPAMEQGFSATYKIGEEEKYSVLLKKDTPVTFTMNLSLLANVTNISDTAENFSGLVLNFAKAGTQTTESFKAGITGSETSDAIGITANETTKLLDITFGSDAGTLSYSGDIVVPKTMTKDNVTYITNSVEFKKADYTKVTSVDISAKKLVNCFGSLGELTGDVALKTLNIDVEEDFSCTDQSFYDVELDSVTLKSKKTMSMGYNSFSGESRKVNSFTMIANTFDSCQIFNYVGDLLSADSLTVISYATLNENFSNAFALYDGCGYTFKNIHLENIYVDSNMFENGNAYNIIESALRNSTLESIKLKNCSSGSENFTSYYKNEWNDMMYSETYKELYFLGKNAKLIPDDTKTIRQYAMTNCGIEDVVIPASVTLINGGSIRNDNIKSLKVDSSNTYYDSRNNCNAIIHTKSNILVTGCKLTVIPNGVTKLGSDSFNGCNSISTITIPSSVTDLGIRTFENCINLATVIFEDGIKTIDSYGDTFNGCTQLNNITIPSTVVDINKRVFKGTPFLTNIKSNENGIYTCIDGKKIVLESPNKNVSDIDLTNVYLIGVDAYADCSELTSVTIPSSVKIIATDAFDGCNITKVNITNVTAWCDIDFRDVYGSYSSQPLYNGADLYLNDEIVSDLVVPSDVKEIKSYAFYNCKSLTSIVIPNDVISIGYSSFYNCINLTSVSIGEGMERVKGGAFSGCVKLSTIAIPNSVVYIGTNAFNNCSNLLNIVGNLKYIKTTTNDYYYLYATTSTTISSVSINNNCKFIGGYAFQNCKNITSIDIPNGVLIIDTQAFSNCRRLTEIIIPDSVTEIGYKAFYNCQNLKIVDVGNGLINLDTSAFESCKSLTTITLPASMKYIEGYIFYDCSSLTTINYLGTIDQWLKYEDYFDVIRGYWWDNNTGDYTVICTDGTIAKNGTITRN